MRIKNTLAICCALLPLVGCGGPSATQGVTKAHEQTGFLGSRKDDFNIKTAEAFKGINEVVIAGFTVSFYTYKTNAAKAGGGLMGNGFGGKSTAKSTLIGVSDDVMQKITDEAYSNFVADLKAKGYKVIDHATLANSPEFASATIQLSPWEDSSETMLTDGNKVKYFSPSSFHGMYILPGITPQGSGLGLDNAFGAAANYGKNHNAHVLYVGLNVNFANADASGGWASTSSNVSVGQGMSVTPASMVGIISGEGGTFSTNIGSIQLGQPISSEKEFAKVSDSTSDTSRGVEMAANVIGTLGGVGSNVSRHFEFHADAGKFKAAALDAIKQANGALTGKMSELK